MGIGERAGAERSGANAERAEGEERRAFEGAIAPGWFVERGPNGGYVAAILLRGLTMSVDDESRTPRSLSIHFPAAAAAGPVRVETAVEREGRSLSYLSARMTQGGRPVALALAAFSGPWSGVEYADTEMPPVPAPEEAEPLAMDELAPTFMANFEMRHALGDLPFSGSERALAGGWLRLADPRTIDALLAATFLDAWAPALFAHLGEPVAAPTVDLTCHFRAPLPPPGATAEDFYLGAFSSRLSREGFWEEDGELWSRDGVLLAQSRQLALALPRHD